MVDSHKFCKQQNRTLQIEAKRTQEMNNNTNLRNITQITEDYNTTLKPPTCSNISEKQQEQPKKLSWTQKYGKCLKFMLAYCYKPKKTQYDVNESELTKQVEKLKRRKSKIDPLLPPAPSNTKTLVLDLDQTLVYSSFKKPKRYDFTMEIDVKGSKQRIYVSKRFGIDIFLFEMSQIYELVVYTAGLKDYTDEVLKNIDPKKRIKHVLYRQHCTILNKSYFLKNLRLLGRNMKQIILVDDNSMAGMMNYQIFYRIDPYYGDQKDRKLLRLIQLLKIMAIENSFDCLLEKRKIYQEKNVKPTCFFNRNLKSKVASQQNQSTQQSTVGKEQNTAMEMVKNIQV